MDPDWIRIHLGPRIWIRIRNPDLDQGGKTDPQNKKKVNIFHLLKCWTFSFGG
jgi:hypothetical protein